MAIGGLMLPYRDDAVLLAWQERGQRHGAAEDSHSSPVLGGPAILLKDQRPEWLWGVMKSSLHSW